MDHHNPYLTETPPAEPRAKSLSLVTHELPPLPYARDALEPHVSARTLDHHHGKHHAKYVQTLNELIQGSNLSKMPLEGIIRATARKKAKAKIFNNAAQVWNHTFLWHSMKPQGGGRPTGAIAERIDEDFGSNEKFAEEFKTAATGQFGSGWAWLVIADGKLAITTTSNADMPLVHGQKPLITLDVWEHAYYLDYQHERPKYVQTFLDHLVNWDFANANLA
jgi:Fe-Mn family superoxide dismutase